MIRSLIRGSFSNRRTQLASRGGALAFVAGPNGEVVGAGDFEAQVRQPIRSSKGQYHVVFLETQQS